MTDRESRQEPSADPLWSDSWYVDFADATGRGGFLRLALLPNLRTVWVWACFVDSRGLVLVRDQDVHLPRGAGLELKGDGLWADMVCEAPMMHWTFGLEAFGVALDDPVEALRGERGDRTPLGFDLEWEAAEPPFDFPEVAGRTHHGHYQHAGRVRGEVLVGADRIAFDGWGQRDRFFGVRDWWGVGWHWAAFRLGDSTTVSVARPDRPGPEHATGYVAVDGEEPHPLTFAEVSTTGGPDGLPRHVSYSLETGLGASLETGLEVAAEVEALAPLVVASPGDERRAHLIRALCRFSSSAGAGFGWAEWLRPV